MVQAELDPPDFHTVPSTCPLKSNTISQFINYSHDLPSEEIISTVMHLLMLSPTLKDDRECPETPDIQASDDFLDAGVVLRDRAVIDAALKGKCQTDDESGQTENELCQGLHRVDYFHDRDMLHNSPNISLHRQPVIPVDDVLDIITEN
jgi:hypothetical protein